MDIQILIAFGIYFALLTSIGLFFYKKSKTSDAFMLGNRSINYWVTAIATQASDMGIWLFMAFPAAVYSQGIPACWIAIGLVSFMFLNWQFIAPKLRAATERFESVTFSTFFERRFNDTSGILRVLSALITLFFFTFYLSSALVGLGRLFESAFGLDYHTGIIVGLAAAAIYTLIGGFVAVAWSDFFQGIFLLCTIVFVPAYAFYYIGGWHPIALTAHIKNIPLTLFPKNRSIIQSIILAVSWGLGYFGQPHILLNFMGIDDTRKIRYAKYVGISWQIIALTAATAVGLVGIGYFPAGLADKEMLFILISKDLFIPILAGFILCAILAATLSTMDSQLLLSGSTLAEDLYKKLFNRDASSGQLLWTSRLGTIMIALLAVVIAWSNSSTVYELVNYAWSGLGSAFGPLVIASLYSTRTTRQGAIASILTGSIVSGVWPYLGTEILPLVPGFTASLLALWLVSRITQK